MESTHHQTQTLALQLYGCACGELYSFFPYFDAALAGLVPVPSRNTESFGTDGERFLFSPEYLIRSYAVRPEILRRGLLHTMLHCLYGHPFSDPGKDPALWHLACDMAVEQIIEKENNPRLALPEHPVKRVCLQILGPKAEAPELLVNRIRNGDFPFRIPEMAAAFLADDHMLWASCAPDAEARWAHLLACAQDGMARHGKNRGQNPGSRWEDLEPVTLGVRDYRSYLRRFAVQREAMELDMESFDPIYYHLGLEHYGNIPLIEPPETREGWKLEELVIAIDTSGSCSRETVRDFLGETCRILTDRENFFRRMNVHLVQCDCMVQDAAVIRSREQWQNYSRTVRIIGRGGTDFTPVFRYVEDQKALGKLRNLKALLYFTDGDGCYPREKPDYETAFVFPEETKHMDAVPKWAHVLLMNDR